MVAFTGSVVRSTPKDRRGSTTTRGASAMPRHEWRVAERADESRSQENVRILRG